MNAELVSIGTELLLGEITDTNSTHIARELRNIGVNVFYITAVGDNLERITNTLKQGLNRSDLIITTGGLGPTVDDMTRQGVAAATNRDLVFHQHLLDIIAERFKKFGSAMSENNRQQALIPADAIIVENPVGTAPCYIVESEHGIIISLPGVPREMKHLLANDVLPYLRRKMGLPAIIKAKVLRCTGIGESHLDDKIAQFMTQSNPTVGLAAHSGHVDIRITARAESEAEADALIATTEAPIRELVGRFIFGVDKDSLDDAVLGALGERGLQMSIIEAGTNGVVTERLQKANNGVKLIHTTALYPDSNTLRQELGNNLTDLKLLAEATVQHLKVQYPDTIAMSIVNEKGNTAVAVSTPANTWIRETDMGNDADLGVWAGNWGLGYLWRYLNETE